MWEKRHNLANHLGNVLTAVIDMKLAINDDKGRVDYYTAAVVSYSDYYLGGLLVPLISLL